MTPRKMISAVLRWWRTRPGGPPLDWKVPRWIFAIVLLLSGLGIAASVADWGPVYAFSFVATGLLVGVLGAVFGPHRRRPGGPPPAGRHRARKEDCASSPCISSCACLAEAAAEQLRKRPGDDDQFASWLRAKP